MGFLNRLKQMFSSGGASGSRGKADYSLEYFEMPAEDDPPGGRGLVVVRNRDGQKLSWRNLRDGLSSVPVAGTSFRAEALQDQSFRPPGMLQLVPEPDNPHGDNAVAIWNQERSLQVGYIPKEYSKEIADLIQSGRLSGCISMWQSVDENDQVLGMRILIIEKGCSIK